ncbi:hypothetical protein [Azospirillum argentinense]|uniref:hypothetical protein n=1 Tax=Azospirillum argentinense TaxID=2970906 RepID=UPI0032DE9767
MEPDPFRLLEHDLHANTPKGKVFRVAAPVKATVLRDEEYRKRDFGGGEELFFQGVREGKGGRLIFEFTPCDAADWTQVEFLEAEIGQAIVGAAAWLEEAFGMPLAKARKHYAARARTEAEEAAVQAQEETTRTYSANRDWGAW